MSTTAISTSGISISITRNMGADIVHYGAQAETANAALALVAALCGHDVPAASVDRELTAATDKVIADAKKTGATTASSASGVKPETTDKKAAAQGGEEKKPASTQNAAPTAKADTATGSPSDVPTYDQVKEKVLALAQAKGRDTLISLLQRHGVTKAPELKESQYARVIEDADAIMAGTYDPAASEELA